MTDLISHCFKDKNKKLVTFVTGGDPDFETSKKIIETIINNNIPTNTLAFDKAKSIIFILILINYLVTNSNVFLTSNY